MREVWQGFRTAQLLLTSSLDPLPNFEARCTKMKPEPILFHLETSWPPTTSKLKDSFSTAPGSLPACATNSHPWPVFFSPHPQSHKPSLNALKLDSVLPLCSICRSLMGCCTTSPEANGFVCNGLAFRNAYQTAFQLCLRYQVGFRLSSANGVICNWPRDEGLI